MHAPPPTSPLVWLPARLQPQPGTLFTLEVERGHGSSAPPPPGAAVVPMLKELAAQRRTFSVKYLQRAFLEVNGKLIALGTFNSDLSNDTTHVSGAGRPPLLRPTSLLLCRAVPCRPACSTPAASRLASACPACMLWDACSNRPT